MPEGGELRSPMSEGGELIVQYDKFQYDTLQIIKWIRKQV
jgi:hypothetical protein